MTATLTVAEFIDSCINQRELKQVDIAEKAGFNKPNVITMIKQGKTRLPWDKIGPIAEALGTDPVQLFHMCLAEYMPDTWEKIAPYLAPVLTPEEARVVKALRACSGGPFVGSLSTQAHSNFQAFMSNFCEPAAGLP